jgi:hypothetical protein
VEVVLKNMRYKNQHQADHVTVSVILLVKNIVE